MLQRQAKRQTEGETDRSYPSHFVLGGGAGVDEGLSDDRQNGVDAVAHLNIQNKLRVLQDVHPEPERETGDRETDRSDTQVKKTGESGYQVSLTCLSSRCGQSLGRQYHVSLPCRPGSQRKI